MSETYNLELTGGAFLTLASGLYPDAFRKPRYGQGKFKCPQICIDTRRVGALRFNYDKLSLTYNIYEAGQAYHVSRVFFAFILHILWRSGTMPEDIVRAYAKKSHMDFSEITHFVIA